MAADVLDRLTRAIYRAMSEQSIFTTKTYLPSLVAGGIATFALMGAGLWETNVYFGRQAASIDTLRGFNPIENSVARDTIAALKAGEQVYLSPTFSSYSPLRFLVYGVIKTETGRNTLDDRPYKIVLPEVSLPIPDDGSDVLMLLDINYWSLRSHIASLYPGASMDLVNLSDGSPIYMRVRVPHEQVTELQGLIKDVIYSNGQMEQQVVKQVELSPDEAQATEVIWSGFIRLEHGGEYELLAEGGLQVYVADQPWDGKRYLGRGLYKLLVVWRGGDIANAQLNWRVPDHDTEPVPAQTLFHISISEQGLLGTYWHNVNWEGEPLFQQVTPFLLLAWPDEQPIVPNGEFSARYVGLLHVTRPGSYLLRVEADDGARLLLDGNVLGEGLIPGRPNTFETTVELEVGDHPIQIDYFQQGGGSALRLFWRFGDEDLAPVPPDALIPIQP
jgi:PA14 domain